MRANSPGNDSSNAVTKTKSTKELYEQTVPFPQQSVVSPRAQGTKISSLEINYLFSLFKSDDEGKNSSANSMPTLPHHGSTSNYNSGTVSIMMTITTSMEEQVANLIKMVEELIKSFTEKDAQIASLTVKLENTAGKVPINATTDLPKT